MTSPNKVSLKRWLAALASVLCTAQAVWSVPLLQQQAAAPGVPTAELVMIGAAGLLFVTGACAFAAIALRRPAASKVDPGVLEELVRLEQHSAERLAGQLHAGPVQSLIAAALMAGTSGAHGGDDLEALTEQLRCAEREVRDVMVETRPPQIATVGFGPVCQHLQDLLDARDGLSVEWDWDLPSSAVMPELTADLAYRFLQEVLGNVAKHSGCATAYVSASLEGGVLTLSVRDHGTGFKPLPLHERRSSSQYRTTGLHMLSARATVLGSRMSLTTGPAQGTTVTLHGPVDDVELTMIRVGPAPIGVRVSV